MESEHGKDSLTVPALPVAPAAVGQSDMRNLGNEQKSIPLKAMAAVVAVGHINGLLTPSIFFFFDFLCIIDCAIEGDQSACPRLWFCASLVQWALI